MPSVMAIVSRKIFDRDFRGSVGDIVATSSYASTHRTFEKLADGGDLFLVTVAPDERLWLVGILARPKFAKDRWTAAANTTAITDITSLIPQLTFESGTGITAKAGALAMSLQTPRVLVDSDLALLRAATGATKQAAPRKTKAAATPKAKAPKAPKAPTRTKTSPSAAPTGTSSGGLEGALANLDAGALAAALDDLLRVWRDGRAAAVANLVEALGAYLASALPAIEGKKLDDLEAAWLAVADEQRTVDVPRLVAAFDGTQSKQLKSWLERFETWEPDPRIAAGAIASVPLFVSSGAGPTRTVAFRLAKAHGESAFCKPAVDAAIRRTRNAWNADELRDRLRKLLAEMPPARALAGDEARTVAKLGKAIEKLAKGPPPDASALATTRKPATSSDGTSSDLLAAVVGDPASDLPRLVYADHLQERGDAYGELIALQLQQDRTKVQDDRIAKLLKDKKQVARWLGPLAAIVSEPVFERGFLQRCRLKLVTPAHRKLLAHPMFGTVEDIECEDAAVLESPAMRALKRLRGASVESLAALADRELPTKVTSVVGVSMAEYTRQQVKRLGTSDSLVPWRTFLDGKAFASVRELGVNYRLEGNATPESLAWVLASRVGRKLEGLVLGDSYPAARTWMDPAPAHAHLSHVRLEPALTNPLDIFKRKGKFDLVLEVDNHEDDYFYDELFAGFPRKDAPVLQLRYVGRAIREIDVARASTIEELGRFFTKIVDAS